MKRLSESVWNSIRQKSLGKESREEFAFHPDYIDFGPHTTVYWAIDNLVIDGEGKLAFQDVKDYNKDGWRLPTLEEVKQLDWENIRHKWYEGRLHIKFPDGNEFRIKTSSNNGCHIWTSEINQKYPTCAHTYGYDSEDKFSTSDFNYRWNKLYVLLVKSKK